MKALSSIRLSMLDLVAVREGGSVADALAIALRTAQHAERLGFTFEGLFRQAIVYKGRSRDTAWYSIIDSEWPRVREAFERWLDPGNFDASGLQRASLADLRAALQPARPR